VTAIFGFITVP